jgi:hypothetical protein
MFQNLAGKNKGIRNKNFWEELISYFSLIGDGPQRKLLN